MTNREAIEYFSKKKQHYPFTDEFMKKEFSQDSGGYIKYVYDINTEDDTKRKQDNNFFISKLNDCLSGKINLITLSFLPEDEKKNILNPFYNKENDEKLISQKWHLLVSYFASKEIVTEYKEEMASFGIKSDIGAFDIDGTFTMRGVTCPELWLWIYESLSKDKTEYYYKKAIEYSKNKRKLLKEWNKTIKEIKEVINNI